MAAVAAAAAAGEGRICPMTGAVGYCPMAKPKGFDPNAPKPELKVMMLVLWEDGDSKVSIGVYPHMNKHWAALDIADTSTKEEIRAQYRKLSVKWHPDKNQGNPAAKERFQAISAAYEALKDVDLTLAFPWGMHPKKQTTCTGLEALRQFGSLGGEAASTDPIKAQMMQHVIKESSSCKVIKFESDTEMGGVQYHVTQVDALCEDARNGSNHLVKIFRRIRADAATENFSVAASFGSENGEEMSRDECTLGDDAVVDEPARRDPCFFGCCTSK